MGEIKRKKLLSFFPVFCISIFLFSSWSTMFTLTQTIPLGQDEENGYKMGGKDGIAEVEKHL